MSDDRRRHGVFYTPDLWAKEVHKYLDFLSDDWVVWDPAAGRGSLVEGLEVSTLILTTLEHEDVDYLKGSYVGQLDFLNDPIPQEILDLIEGKKLLILMNPPYVAIGNNRTDGKSKKGATKTRISEEMKSLSLNGGQLYVQFLYRAASLGADAIAVLSGRAFLSTPSFARFRKWFFASYAMRSGFLFQASEFADVADYWGVLFSLWFLGDEGLQRCELKRRVGDSRIETFDTKDLYAAEDKHAGLWFRELTRGLRTERVLPLSSGEGVHKSKSVSLVERSLVALYASGNNLSDSHQGVYLMSSGVARAGGQQGVTPENWDRMIAYFSARKLIKGNWINDKDEFLIPDVDALGYEEWLSDCHIYTWLHPFNYCASLRGMEYKGRVWNLTNHFFWRVDLPEDLVEDYEENPPHYIVEKPYSAFLGSEPPMKGAFFASRLGGLGLSERGERLLSMVNSIWESNHDERWDAGIYQLRRKWRGLGLWGSVRDEWKKLEEDLRDGVYQFGFLRK